MQGQGRACSDMADTFLIKWPCGSPLYFTKPGVHWEYATVAGESAQAFVYFTEAGMRAWRTAQHADHRPWRNIYLFCPGRGPIPGGCPVPPRVELCAHVSVCVCVGIGKQLICMHNHSLHRSTIFSLLTNPNTVSILLPVTLSRVSLRNASQGEK